MSVDLKSWISERRITEVECMVSDHAGIPRGKILPAAKFLDGIGERGLRLPEAIFGQDVTGSYIEEKDLDQRRSDIFLAPQADTIRMVPWYKEPTAQIINDAYYQDGSPVDIAPRMVLKKILQLYADKGWRPVVAPELEFFLVKGKSVV